MDCRQWGDTRLSMNKKDLSERDICTKFITPALKSAGWDEMTQIREEVGFTKGRIIVRGKRSSGGSGKQSERNASSSWRTALLLGPLLYASTEGRNGPLSRQTQPRTQAHRSA